MPLIRAMKTGDGGGPEYRRSTWVETDRIHHTGTCPRCKADVSSIKVHREHWDWHARQDERARAVDQAIIDLAAAVRALATEMGHGDWYPDDESGGEEAPIDGYVLGTGPLPEEMRGGEE